MIAPPLALGIDIGGTSVKVALLARGQLAAVGRSSRYARPDLASLATAVAQAIQQACSSHPPSPVATPTSPAPLGLCVPGVIDPVSRTVRAALNLPALVGVSLDPFLADALARTPLANLPRLPPAILSDAHAAALDLARESALPPGQRLLAISLGTGVGACVLDADPTSGRLVRLLVAEGSSGHLGQIDVRQPEPDRQPPIASDGSVGTLEAYVGWPSLERRTNLSGEAALAGLLPGSVPFAALVHALRIAHAIYRPHTIALLGGVGMRLAPQLAPLRDEVARGLTSLARPDWRLICGRSDHHAAIGVARWAVESAPPVA